MPRICKKCGYERQEVERVSESECPNCGAIYTKVEARLKREAEELLRQEEQIEKEHQSAITRYNKEKEGKKEIIQLDCSACKTKASMKATKIPKFNTILRIIGFIIVIPSVVGVLMAILIFIASIIATATTQSSAGAAIDATISFGFSLFIGCSSLVGGIIGWLMLMEKKVYKCINCGFILDRA